MVSNKRGVKYSPAFAIIGAVVAVFALATDAGLAGLMIAGFIALAGFWNERV